MLFRSSPDRRRARWAMVAALVLIAALGIAGKSWWDAEDNAFQRFIYKPLGLDAAYDTASGRLLLELRKSGWLQKNDDLIPDHNHLIHLYVVSVPKLDKVWHLHPDMVEPGKFVHAVPPMPSGLYRLFADIVHQTGFPETLTTEIRLPSVKGTPLTGDDSAGESYSAAIASKTVSVFEFSDGHRMIWERPSAPLQPSQPEFFRFRLEDANGQPASDMELYMGMPGHAAFVKTDLTVFAHVHPSGTVPMAALSLAASDPHAGHAASAALPATVAFPFAFPKSGAYRIFVQVKRAGKVITGVFDARAGAP